MRKIIAMAELSATQHKTSHQLHSRITITQSFQYNKEKNNVKASTVAIKFQFGRNSNHLLYPIAIKAVNYICFEEVINLYSRSDKSFYMYLQLPNIVKNLTVENYIVRRILTV